ncbi:MAG: flagellar basal body rod protein FlgB [Dehalococcoidia bacterium]|nr:flagellar basal body rod protein FlgB [Dehalococcoidia bacterium]
MLGQIFAGSFAVARQALDGLSQRQDAIASNVANVDTPGYRRREVTFEDTLAQQVNMSSAVLRTTDPRHIASRDSTSPGDGGAVRERDVVSSRNDANDVSIDEEMLLLAETQLRYQALTQGVGRRLTTLRTVIRGG